MASKWADRTPALAEDRAADNSAYLHLGPHTEKLEALHFLLCPLYEACKDSHGNEVGKM